MTKRSIAITVFVTILSISYEISSASPPSIRQYENSFDIKRYEPLLRNIPRKDAEFRNMLNSAIGRLESRATVVDEITDERDDDLPKVKRTRQEVRWFSPARRLRTPQSSPKRLPEIPVDEMVKILRELGRRRKLGSIDYSNAEGLTSALEELAPRREFVSVGLDLQAISRMVAERKLRKYRKQHGANHQKLLSIG